MNILLTGATGFIGSYIFKLLKDEGYNIIGFDNFINNTSIQQVFTPEEIDKSVIIKGNIQDLPALIHTCQDYKINTIIHNASLMGSETNNYSEAVKVNILGTINIFETARILNMRRVVWASSQTVYGPQDKHPQEFIPKDAPHFPETNYSASKSYLEFVGRYYYDYYGLDNIALRYCAVYGIGRLRGSDNFLNELIIKPAYDLPAIVEYKDASPNLIYVKDAARATLLACTVNSTKRRAFTITGEAKPVKAVRDYILTLLPDAEITLKPKAYSCSWSFDTHYVEEELGYKPGYSAEEGMKETINLIRKSRNLPAI